MVGGRVGGGDGTWPRELLPAKAPEHEAVGDTTFVFRKQNEFGLHSDGLIFFSLVWTPWPEMVSPMFRVARSSSVKGLWKCAVDTVGDKPG